MVLGFSYGAGGFVTGFKRDWRRVHVTAKVFLAILKQIASAFVLWPIVLLT